MKIVITAILPIILIAQIPFHATSYLPSEWMKSFQYGLKWTELMMNGYPGFSEASESIPEGAVTTTVVLASAVPEFEDIEISIEEDYCEDYRNEELKRAREEAVEILVEMNEQRVLEMKTSHAF